MALPPGFKVPSPLYTVSTGLDTPENREAAEKQLRGCGCRSVAHRAIEQATGAVLLTSYGYADPQAAQIAESVGVYW